MNQIRSNGIQWDSVESSEIILEPAKESKKSVQKDQLKSQKRISRITSPYQKNDSSYCPDIGTLQVSSSVCVLKAFSS